MAALPASLSARSFCLVQDCTLGQVDQNKSKLVNIDALFDDAQ